MGGIFKRAMGIQGISTFYTTGVDEHGQKNAREIDKSGLSSEEYLDGQCLKFTSLFERLDIQADYFVRTSRERHKQGVSSILERLFGEGKDLNSYVDDRKPWIMAKDYGRKGELESVLRTGIEGVRLLFEAAWPVMPKTSEQVLPLLALALPVSGIRHEFKPFRLREGENILPGKVLFPRL